MLDMAIICKEAASSFLENMENFEISSVAIYNSDLLLVENKNINTIAVTQERAYQKDLVRNYYPDANIVEMMASALPYALKNGNADAVVMDAVKAIGLPGEKHRLDSQGDYSSYVLLVNKDFRKTKDYKEFIRLYNKSLDKLLGDELKFERHLESYIKAKPLGNLKDLNVKLEYLDY